MTSAGERPPADVPPVGAPQGPRRLLRSRKDQVIGGVAAGIGHYFGIDPVLVRIAFVLLLLAGGSGFLLYIVLWIVIPEASPEEDVAWTSSERNETGALVIGGALVVIGVVLILRRIIPWFDSELVWPLLLVGLGALILLKGVRR